MGEPMESEMEIEDVETRLAKVEKKLRRPPSNDPALIATRTQNWITLIAIIIALVGIPTAYNVSRFDALTDRVSTELDATRQVRSELIDRIALLSIDMDDRMATRFDKLFAEQNTRSKNIEKELFAKFELLEERVDDVIGRERAGRVLTIRIDENYDDPTSPEFSTSNGVNYCRAFVGFIVRNETDYLTEVIAERSLYPWPFAYAGTARDEFGYYDGVYNDLSDFGGRFLPGKIDRHWVEQIDVSQEHAANILSEIDEFSATFKYDIFYKTGYNQTATTTQEYEADFSPNFYRCLGKLAALDPVDLKIE